MTDDRPMPSLRERKRLAAMHRIQTVALDLFEDRGFDRTTVEQIAEIAQVSPSSVYRYFGSKERIVIWDEFDAQAIADIGAEVRRSPPLVAMRLAVEQAVLPAMAADEERIHRRMRLAFTTPSIEVAAVQETYAVAGMLVPVLTDRGGLSGLEAEVCAHAFVGALLGGLRHWYQSDFTTPMAEIIELVLEVLERGMGEG